MTKRLLFLAPVLALSALCWYFPTTSAVPPSRDGAQSAYFCGEIKKPLFAEVKAGTGEFKAQRSLALPEKFIMPKPAGVKRVFIIGESVAEILESGSYALYGAAHRGGLAGQPPGDGLSTGKANSGLEIINCGMGGYESVRIYGILKEVLRYSPDLLVVLSGNNEGSPEPCPGPGFELRRREARLLERYYSLKDEPREAKKKASFKLHGAMLGKMARAAGKAGVPVVFCTLPANVKDTAMRGPVELTDALFASGYKLFYEKKYGAALEKFRLGLEERPDGYFLNLYAAKTLEKLGRTAGAGAYFFKALSLEDNMTRSTVDRNALIRRVAGSEGACVADLEALFYKLSPGGLPGFAEFTDGLHWRPAYNKAVWDEIFRSAAACGIRGFEKFSAWENKSRRETPREDALKRLSYAVTWLDASESCLNEGSLAGLSYIRQKLPGLLEAAAVSPEALDKLIIHNLWNIGKPMRLKDIFPLFLAHLAETERRSGNYGAALSLCERALFLKPGAGGFGLLRAQILAGLGRRQEAEKEFLESGLRREALALGLAYGFDMSYSKSPDRK